MTKKEARAQTGIYFALLESLNAAKLRFPLQEDTWPYISPLVSASFLGSSHLDSHQAQSPRVSLLPSSQNV